MRPRLSHEIKQRTSAEIKRGLVNAQGTVHNGDRGTV